MNKSFSLLSCLLLALCLHVAAGKPLIDPIKFTISTSETHIELDKEFELTITAEYMNVSPNIAFVLEGSNLFVLRLILPEGFTRTGGDFQDFVKVSLDKNNSRASYKVRGKFTTSDSPGTFQLLRSHRNADYQSTFVAVGKITFKAWNGVLSNEATRESRVLAGSPGFVPYLSTEQLRNGYADTARVVVLSAGQASRIFIYDPLDTTTPDDSAMTIVDGSKRYKSQQLGRYFVEDFNAVGDWNKSDSTGTNNRGAFQRCINYVISQGGGVISCRTSGNFLIKGGSVYINTGGNVPITLDFGIDNSKYSGASVHGVTIVGDDITGGVFKVNYTAAGNGFNGASAQYAGFAAKGFSAMALDSGIHLFEMFRTRSSIRNISTNKFDWVVYQANTDASGNSNYCDQSIYDFIKVGHPRIGGLRLVKADASRISSIFFEGDTYPYRRGIEIAAADGVTVEHILQWYAGGTALDTLVPNSRFISLLNCSAVNVRNLHVERCPQEYMISVSGCTGVTISQIMDKFSRRNGLLVSGASRGVKIFDWYSYSNVIGAYADIQTALSVPAVADVSWDNSYFTSNPGDVARAIVLDAAPASPIRKGNSGFSDVPISGSIFPTVNGSGSVGTSSAYFGSVRGNNLISGSALVLGTSSAANPIYIRPGNVSTNNVFGWFGGSGSTFVQGLGEAPTEILSSQLTVYSTTKGVILPRMTSAQKNAIVSPAEGLEVYDTTLHAKCYFNGTVWKTIATL